MDAAGIDMQVLSLTPLDWNSSMLRLQKGSPARRTTYLARQFGATDPFCRIRRFAHSPAGTAAGELERTVRDYGFKGAVVNGHNQGRYMDDPFFWPIFERAEALQVPFIYIPHRPRSRSSRPLM